MKELLELELRVNEESRKLLVRDLYNIGKDAIELDIGIDKKALKAVHSDIDKINAKYKKNAENWADAWEKSMDKTQNQMNKLVSTIGELKGGDGKRLFEGLSKGMIRGVGTVTKQLGKQLSSLGESQKGGLGVLFKGLGPAVGMLGAVTTSLASFVSLLLEAESVAKGYNKQLLEGGLSAQDLGRGMFNVNKSLDVVRSAFIENPLFNIQWGTLAKEQFDIVNAFNSSGVAIKRVVDLTADMNKQMLQYQTVASTALTYSKLFGIQATEMAADQSKYMDSLGGGLKFIEEQFASVHKAAQFSGYSVKWFYSSVQQATSGMAMYNVRMSDAAGLLIKLSRVLGAQKGAEVLGSVTKGYADVGMTERRRQIMVGGAGSYKRSFKSDSAKMDKITADKVDASGAGKIAKVLEKHGIKTAAGAKGADILKATEKMSRREFDKFAADLGDDGLTRELGKMRDLQEAATGNLEKMTEHLDMLSPGSVLYHEIHKSGAILKKPIHELIGVEKDAFQATAGISGEQYEALKEISRSMYANYANVEDQSDEIRNLRKDGKSVDAEKLNKEMVEKFQAAVNYNGETVAASFDEFGNIVFTDSKITDEQSYFETAGDQFAAITAETMEANTAFAMQVASNTADMSVKLDSFIGVFLEKIYDVMSDMWAWLPGSIQKLLSTFGLGDSDAVDYKDKEQKMRESMDKQTGFSNQMVKLNQERSELKTASLSEKDTEKRVEAQKALKAKDMEIAKVKLNMDVERKKYSKISSAVTKQDLDESGKLNPGDIEKALETAGYSGDYMNRLVQKVGKEMFGGIDGNVVGFMSSEINDQVAQMVLDGSSMEDAIGKATSIENIAELSKKYNVKTVANENNDVLTAANFALGGPAAMLGSMAAQSLYQMVNPTRDIQLGSDMEDENIINKIGLSDLSGLEKLRSSRIYTRMSQEGMQKYDSSSRDLKGSTYNLAKESQYFGTEYAKGGKDKEGNLGKSAKRQSELLVDLNNNMFDLLKTSNEEAARIAAEEKKKNDIDERQRTAAAELNAKLTADKIDENQRKAMLTEFLTSKGATIGEAIGDDEELTKIVKGVFGNMETAEKEFDRSKGYNDLIKGGLKDFIYSPTNGLMSFSDQDTVVGAKPGGPIDKMIGGKKGGGNVTINVYGGDEQKILTLVKKVLNEYGM